MNKSTISANTSMSELTPRIYTILARGYVAFRNGHVGSVQESAFNDIGGLLADKLGITYGDLVALSDEIILSGKLPKQTEINTTPEDPDLIGKG